MWRSIKRNDRLYVAVCCCRARNRQTSQWPTFVATDHLCDPLLFCVTWPHVRFYLVHFDTKFELSSLYQRSKYLLNSIHYESVIIFDTFRMNVWSFLLYGVSMSFTASRRQSCHLSRNASAAGFPPGQSEFLRPGSLLWPHPPRRPCNTQTL